MQRQVSYSRYPPSLALTASARVACVEDGLEEGQGVLSCWIRIRGDGVQRKHGLVDELCQQHPPPLRRKERAQRAQLVARQRCWPTTHHCTPTRATQPNPARPFCATPWAWCGRNKGAGGDSAAQQREKEARRKKRRERRGKKIACVCLSLICRTESPAV